MASGSSSMAAAAAAPSAPASHLSSVVSGAPPATANSSNSSILSAAQFREIHKNTWLKRLTAEGKKITVGPKKSDRSWVVFCVHDDTEALLEGYAEPRQAASHNPEWLISLQDTLHISHALIPNSHEFEFVVTLSNEVIRFHAMSWEIMQEWVETLRSKLREMKILSPRENLYTKLPEIRAPLLPTRDPTSPLPAPPPVPAALVPGVERVVPPSLQQESNATETIETSTRGQATVLETIHSNTENNAARHSTSNSNAYTTTTTAITTTASTNTASTAHAPILSAMSNTLTQNLLNMLSDPISAYSEQLNGVMRNDDGDEDAHTDVMCDDDLSSALVTTDDDFQLLRKTSDRAVRVDVAAGNRISADQIPHLESFTYADRSSIARPQTSRSLSAGAADETRRSDSRKHGSKQGASSRNHNHVTQTTSSSDNITELDINAEANTTTNLASRLTSSTAMANAKNDSDKTNITIIQVSTANVADTNSTPPSAEVTPKIATKLIAPEVFKFPDTYSPIATCTTTKAKPHEYKSNVQIIPSNNATNSSTIQVLGQQLVGSSATANQYSTPVKKTAPTKVAAVSTSTTDLQRITTVHVAGDVTGTKPSTISTLAQSAGTSVAVYGTCFSGSAVQNPNGAIANGGTPKLPKKIILSANTSGVTNITVNNALATDSPASVSGECVASASIEAEVKHNIGNVHYEKVFLSSSIPITTEPMTSTSATALVTTAPMSPKTLTQWNSPVRQAGALIPITSQTSSTTPDPLNTSSQISTSSITTTAAEPRRQKSSSVSTTATQTQTPITTNSTKSRTRSTQPTTSSSRSNFVGGSPALERRRIASPTSRCIAVSTSQPPLPARPPFLTRGLTEAVITARPSRRDFHFLKQPTNAKTKTPHTVASSTKPPVASTSSNNNDDNVHPPTQLTTGRSSDLLEQRKRSSSTSDARNNTRGANNNEFASGRNGVGNNGSGSYAALRIQQPPQPFRSMENGVGGMGIGNGSRSPPPPANGPATNSPAKRMTLREQQVMQLRREIMHPGGVRLQLRRKDCVGSIAWVDAFGAVWVAGWKQKEHPVLYNALHIGDQLLSIAGISISSAAEANKIIRNTNTLFVEVLVRRMPFGRGYAIRREREGQCLGLIRDGNTSTIVDVVPNSLAARHGLPPKAQSCDGLTLTFWVLTEINGRPLNLFFKDNEIRDRLNSVGRDISILVQPSDLITKLKKQLKSLRGYKDYLVQ